MPCIVVVHLKRCFQGGGRMITPRGSKTAAVVSYITWAGWIIAYIIRDRNDEFTTRHINQALAINVLSLISGLVHRLPFIRRIGGIFSLAVFLCFIIGIYRAATGVWEPLPVVGDVDWVK